MIRDAFGLIYAGEQNLHLRELTYLRTVGALPVGGRYRAIDFVMSNMVNSGIHNVGVVAQRSYQSLMDHLGSGKAWDLSRKSEGLYILPPYSNYDSPGDIRGLIDALKGVMSYIRHCKQPYIVLTGSFTIYNHPYDDVLRFHKDSGADITMMYNEEDPRAYSGTRFQDVRIAVADDGRVTDIEIDSPLTDSRLCGMDTYIMRKDLLEYLVEDAISRGKHRFVSDLMLDAVGRMKVMGFRYDGYVGRLHSVASYYKMNMDFLDYSVQRDLFYSDYPVYTKTKDEVPAKYTATSSVRNSLVANGCIVEGEVENSILFRGVFVGRGARIRNCIIMQDSEIYNNVDLEYVILDKSVNIRQGRRLVGDQDFPVIIRKGAMV